LDFRWMILAGLEARGVLVRLRHSAVRPGEVTGYAG